MALLESNDNKPAGWGCFVLKQPETADKKQHAHRQESLSRKPKANNNKKKYSFATY